MSEYLDQEKSLREAYDCVEQITPAIDLLNRCVKHLHELRRNAIIDKICMNVVDSELMLRGYCEVVKNYIEELECDGYKCPPKE